MLDRFATWCSLGCHDGFTTGNTRRPIFSSICRHSVKKEGSWADERSRGRGRDGRIGRKARFVDFEPPWFFPRPFPFVVAFSCGRRHYGRSSPCRPFSTPSISLPPIDRETRNGDSLNLDPVLMEHSPDNGFGMLWRLDVSRTEYPDLVWIWLRSAEQRRS